MKTIYQELQEAIEELQEVVAPLSGEIEAIKTAAARLAAPIYEEIKGCEKEVLSRFVVDSRGCPIQKGDVLVRNGVEYLVRRACLQNLCGQYLGSVSISVRKVGGKRNRDVFLDELREYTVMNRRRDEQDQ